MIKLIQAKPITGMTFSPTPAQQSQSESIAAPAEVGQGLGTITCAACGSTNTEPCCHPSEFCQAICNDCNTPLNADGSVWVEKQEPTLEQFQRWLEERCNSIASEAAHPWTTPSDAIRLELEYSIPFGAKKLLVEFMLEQGA